MSPIFIICYSPCQFMRREGNNGVLRKNMCFFTRMTGKAAAGLQDPEGCLKKGSAVEKYRLLRETRRVLRRERLAQERNAKL